MKLSEIAQLIGAELNGEDIDITGLSDLDHQRPATLAYADSPRNLEKLAATPVSALLLPLDLPYQGKPTLRLKSPKKAFGALLAAFSPYEPYTAKTYPMVYIAESAVIGQNVTILPHTCIMDEASIGDGTIIYSQVFIGKSVSIGKNCIIKAGVKIDDHSRIGDNVIIHHNSVIGGEGFGYNQRPDGSSEKIPQIGTIAIEDDVEIGSCVCIDRATIGTTHIRRGVKIDNLVQIAHNVTIGEDSIVVAQVGIAGSSSTGKGCILAGQAGIADHVHLGDNVLILAQAGVDRQEVAYGSVLRGTPARDLMLSKRISAAEEHLPELVKTVKELKRRVMGE